MRLTDFVVYDKLLFHEHWVVYGKLLFHERCEVYGKLLFHERCVVMYTPDSGPRIKH